MYYVGIDYHKKFSYGAMMDEKGKLIKLGRIDNTSIGIKKFVDGYSDKEVSAVMEATRNWIVMYNYLEEVAEEVKLAHPLKVKAIAEARIKTDKIDATTLAHLLRCDLLPEAHVPSKEARKAREVLRQRMFFVRIQTMIKNRIRGLVDKHPEVGEAPCKDLFSKQSLEWLKKILLPEYERKILDEDIKLLETIRERIEESNNLVEELAKNNKTVEYLMSIPGIGKFFAVLICYEIDNIDRFATVKKLHSYVGLIPSTYASGNRIFHGRITKQGNKWLRWALVEAVWPAIRTDDYLFNYYQRLKAQKGANQAKVATARKLLSIVYRVLKEKRCYQIRGLS